MTRAKREDEVMMNITLPRPLHRRMSIAAAVVGCTLKDAAIAGIELWVTQHAGTVSEATKGHDDGR